MAKLKLMHPLKFGEKTFDELTFRDYPIAADYLSFDRRGGVAQRIALIASLTGTDESIIERLHGADYRRAEQMSEKMMADDEAEAMKDDAHGQWRERRPNTDCEPRQRAGRAKSGIE